MGEGTDNADAAVNKPGKFIPSRLRDRDRSDRDDSCTLRVTNLVEETTDFDMRELFSRFGAINRVYVGKDRETGMAKGFAYVTFCSKFDAEKAMVGLNGHRYGHLILKVEWSKPAGEK